MAIYDVFGLENALMDVQSFVPEKLLNKLKIPKGVMHLVDEKQSREILGSITEYKTNSLPGGSCANTMSTIAMLGGKSVFSGVVADDFYGRLYESKIAQRGVKALIIKKNIGLTGTSIVLTTEDAERTMNTHLGVCQEFYKEDLDIEILSQSKVFHTTGYMWDTASQKEAVNYAMESAHRMDLKVSFDIADPFCIERNVNDFKNIISKVNILFSNKDESKILTGCSEPTEAGKKIREMGAEIVIVKIGGEGSLLFYKDNIIKIDVYKPEKVLDSTGCGDVFAGGFLYGYTRGYDLEKCAKIASLVASRIISVPGVHLEILDMNKIKEEINEIIK